MRLALGIVFVVAGCGSDATNRGDAADTALATDTVVAHDTNALDAHTPDTLAPGACSASDGDGETTLVFVNACAKAVTVHGSDIAEAALAPGERACRDIGSDVESLPSKRYWGFTGDDPGAGHYTLAELTYNTDFHDFDWYNISHVDAFNLPMRIVPLAHADCDTLMCDDPALLDDCPAEGQLRDGAGALVACVSPDRDDPDGAVPRHFESCDDAYAWSGDDHIGDDPSPVRACAGEDWEITFCP